MIPNHDIWNYFVGFSDLEINSNTGAFRSVYIVQRDVCTLQWLPGVVSEAVMHRLLLTLMVITTL